MVKHYAVLVESHQSLKLSKTLPLPIDGGHVDGQLMDGRESDTQLTLHFRLTIDVEVGHLHGRDVDERLCRPPVEPADRALRHQSRKLHHQAAKCVAVLN